ncbi:hypothetical protein [Agromyces larvae]|uniref:CdiI immunity protein domain-containing protein n=1 Tax=Agromyces larvae TaxID=2929802 RepID=A0ABY4C296_9MICO|nr:hypothetical protein [Agromyces larvae]UOE45498.1 hypothetical protein MTO99_07000 [Agromyces larvae]
MSFDVQAGLDWHNYTSNMHRFFRDFDAYPPDWDGMDRYEVAERIDAALTMIESNDLGALKAEYDAPNGWGSVETAIGFLRSVRDSCRQVVPKRVRVLS